MAKTKNTNSETSGSAKPQFVFGNANYKLMLIGLAVIVLGFVVMYGKEGDIYDFRRTTLAPIIVIAGFIIEFFAIMKTPKGE
ncbi:DUF3098 domain-containing protein [Bacteroidia bacterium]|nr:DUF3098 domain-containing protein [Bacteroidia bacterium]